MALIASFLMALAATAGSAAETAPAGDAASGTSLRALAEIDGDPATFTHDERRKFAVLAQVLGTDPTAAPEASRLLSERS